MIIYLTNYIKILSFFIIPKFFFTKDLIDFVNYYLFILIVKIPLPNIFRSNFRSLFGIDLDILYQGKTITTYFDWTAHTKGRYDFYTPAQRRAYGLKYFRFRCVYLIQLHFYSEFYSSYFRTFLWHYCNLYYDIYYFYKVFVKDVNQIPFYKIMYNQISNLSRYYIFFWLF